MSTTTALVASVISSALWAVAGWAAVSCVLRGWSPRRLAARSRSMLVTATVDAVVALALVRALAPPPGITSWLWVLACAAVGVGVAGAVRRWRSLPPFKPRRRFEPGRQDETGKGGADRRRHPWRLLAAGGYVAVGIGLVAVLA